MFVQLEEPYEIKDREVMFGKQVTALSKEVDDFYTVRALEVAK